MGRHDENVCKSVNNWQCKREDTPKQNSESHWPDGMQSVPVKTTQNRNGNQSNATFLSASTYLVNIVLRGFYIQSCIKTLIYIHKDTTYIFASYTKQGEGGGKKGKARRKETVLFLFNSFSNMFFPPLETFIGRVGTCK